MNNKGFTTIEVILSFALVVIVMVSMTSMLVSYRDTITDEEIKTRLVEFKNSFTYMVYEDVVYNGINGLRYCDTGKDESGNDVTYNNGKCVDFIRDGEPQFRLRLIDQEVSIDGETNQSVMKVFLDYRGIRLMLPDSDLNKVVYKDINTKEIDTSKQIAVMYDFIVPEDSTYGITSLTIPFEHHGINYRDNIKIIIAK